MTSEPAVGFLNTRYVYLLFRGNSPSVVLPLILGVLGVLLFAACSIDEAPRVLNPDRPSPATTPSPVSTTIPTTQVPIPSPSRSPMPISESQLQQIIAQILSNPDSTPSFLQIGERAITQTEHIDFSVFPGSISDEAVEEHAGTIEDNLHKVSRKFGLAAPSDVKVLFRAPDRAAEGSYCPSRGFFVTDRRSVVNVLADQQTGSAQIYAVAAHELGHLVAKGRFGSKLADGVISEGVATWAAEDPWLAWLGFNSFDSAVRTIVSDGAYIPFSEAFESEISGLSVDECWESRNIQYTEWASFVGYLIEEYGMDTLARLWDTGKEPRQTSVRIRGTGSGPPAIAPLLSSTPSSEDMIPPKLDYQGVYGKSLEELELEWLNVLGLSAGN